MVFQQNLKYVALSQPEMDISAMNGHRPQNSSPDVAGGVARYRPTSSSSQAKSHIQLHRWFGSSCVAAKPMGRLEAPSKHCADADDM